MFCLLQLSFGQKGNLQVLAEILGLLYIIHRTRGLSQGLTGAQSFLTFLNRTYSLLQILI